MEQEIIKKFESISFNVLWPDDEWSDIGFTENMIWISSKGYGFFSCDETFKAVRLDGIDDYEWNCVDCISQRVCQCLGCDDLSKTIIYELQTIAKRKPQSVYAGLNGEIICITDSYETFCQKMERKECDVKWSELTEEELTIWKNRLENRQKSQENFFETIDFKM